ncbi:MAG: lamin tail domain-containing protein [Candidatus Moraniibacteriota bacterium]
MFIYQIKFNKREKLILIKKLRLILVILFFGLSLNNISGTNSFFTDSAEIKGIEFKAGVWIPTLTMTVEPEEPDGEDETYTEAPCVKLFSDIDDVTIHYSFSGDTPSEGTILEDVCLYPPEGESELIAWAVNNENDDWMSDTIQEDFKVATKAKEGDVVINELMWMGSVGDEKDEWIELRNMTNRDIDLSNWNIMSGGNSNGNDNDNGNGDHIEIPHGYTIKANDYFLITAKKEKETEINLTEDLKKDEGYTHVSGMDLRDSGEQLILTSKNEDVIDTAWKDEKWPDGFMGDYLAMSMQRKEVVPDGELDSSWYTCANDECNDEKYWKKDEGVNWGTPGKKNSEEGDSLPANSDEFEEEILRNGFENNPMFKEIYTKNFLKEKPSKDNASQPTSSVERAIPEEEMRML